MDHDETRSEVAEGAEDAVDQRSTEHHHDTASKGQWRLLRSS